MTTAYSVQARRASASSFSAAASTVQPFSRKYSDRAKRMAASSSTISSRPVRGSTAGVVSMTRAMRTVPASRARLRAEPQILW